MILIIMVVMIMIIIRIMVGFSPLLKLQGKGAKAHCDGSSSREITGASNDHQTSTIKNLIILSGIVSSDRSSCTDDGLLHIRQQPTFSDFHSVP